MHVEDSRRVYNLLKSLTKKSGNALAKRETLGRAQTIDLLCDICRDVDDLVSTLYGHLNKAERTKICKWQK